MLRRPPPSGDLPQVQESAYVDHTAMLCGKVIVHENVFIGPQTDLDALPRLSAQASEFSEDVARTNNELVQGYKKLQNEF